MRKIILVLVGIVGFALASNPALMQQPRGGEDETGPYEVVPNWPQKLPHEGYVWGSQGGVFAESSNRIILLNRGELKLPEKLPNNFTGWWGSIGAAINGMPEMRNCIVIVEATGR